MKVTFLEAGLPLTKHYRIGDKGVESDSYPLVKNFTSHTKNYSNLKQLATLLSQHAALGHCMLKGNLQRELVQESRAGTTLPDAETQLELHDLDGAPFNSVEEYVAQLPARYQGVDYLIQYSASMGIKPGLRAHVFFLMKHPESPAQLKLWFKHLNLTIDPLRTQLKLNSGKITLSWPLDITICQNDKLIYIATPTLEPGVPCTFTEERIQYVRKQYRMIQDPVPDLDIEEIKRVSRELVNDLRKTEGLTLKRVFSKFDEKTCLEMLNITDVPRITNINESNGFVHMSLDGKDNLAYYHPVDNYKLIRSFTWEEDEAVLTSVFLPEYYKKCVKAEVQAKEEEAQTRQEELQAQSEGLVHLAFIDNKTNQYYRGTYDPVTDSPALHGTGSRTVAIDYMHEHGFEEFEIPPTWNVVFEPFNTQRVDIKRKTYNLFAMTDYLANAEPAAQMPPLINRIIRHALGNDNEAFERFINWLAYIFQTRNKSGQSWIIQGTYGTGKNLITDKIIAPLIGLQHTIHMSLNSIATDMFNEHLQTAVFGVLDESDLDSIPGLKKKLHSTLKNLITADDMSYRIMRKGNVEGKSYLNLIITTNEAGPIQIVENDRRHSVAPRQEQRLEITTKEVEETIPSELQAFADFIMHYEYNEFLARTSLENESKARISQVSNNSVENLCNVFHRGDLAYLIEMAPHNELATSEFNIRTMRNLPTYGEALREIWENRDTGSMSRDALHTIMLCLTDKVPLKPTGFTQYLGHHRLYVKPLKLKGKCVRGVSEIKWHVDEETEALYTEYTQSRMPPVPDNVTPLKGTQ